MKHVKHRRRAATPLATLLIAGQLTLGVAVATTVQAPSASAAGACATKTEYKKVANGIGFRKVKRIFGGAPTTSRDNGAGDMAAMWRKCGTSVGPVGEMAGACIGFHFNKVNARSWATESDPVVCVPPGGPS